MDKDIGNISHPAMQNGIHLEYCEDSRDNMKNNLITWIWGDEWNIYIYIYKRRQI